MYVKHISHVVDEIGRFNRAIQVLTAFGTLYEFKKDRYEGGKYTAAVRRASLDLTRALAQLRKNY